MQKTVSEQVDDVKMMYHRFQPVAIEVEKDGIGLATLQLFQVAGLPIYDVNADAFYPYYGCLAARLMVRVKS